MSCEQYSQFLKSICVPTLYYPYCSEDAWWNIDVCGCQKGSTYYYTPDHTSGQVQILLQELDVDAPEIPINNWDSVLKNCLQSCGSGNQCGLPVVCNGIWRNYGYACVFSMPQCSLGSVSISPSEVRPAKTGDDSLTKATIGIALTSPAPSSGCEVKLRIEPGEGTGGHSHDENRKAHTGKVEPDSILFVPGESILNGEYTSGEVAGTEKIIAEVLDSNGSVSSTQSVSIDVKVKDLESFSSPTPYYQLTGSKPAHTANHFGLHSTDDSMGHVADDYYIGTGALLGINDMSLEGGGLFDIDANWSPPHRSHRKGTSVDIDRCAESAIPNNPNARTCVTSYDKEGNPVGHTCDPGYICVERREIERLCWDNGHAIMVDEATHHCEW